MRVCIRRGVGPLRAHLRHAPLEDPGMEPNYTDVKVIRSILLVILHLGKWLTPAIFHPPALKGGLSMEGDVTEICRKVGRSSPGGLRAHTDLP